MLRGNNRTTEQGNYSLSCTVEREGKGHGLYGFDGRGLMGTEWPEWKRDGGSGARRDGNYGNAGSLRL